MKQIAGWRRWSTLVWAALMMVSTTVGADDDNDVDEQAHTGAVYTMSNATTGNAVLVFRRAANGSLTPAAGVPTGGLGVGRGLGNQNAVVLSDDRRWLFAVNAGSNDVSVFAVRRGGLTLVDRAVSGGTQPVSVSFDHGLLYVLNAGGTGNISGFTLARNGKLTPLADSIRPLSGAATAPAQIAFNPDGKVLVVTEKATNNISTYTVDNDGRAHGPLVYPAAGTTPFGFAFDQRGRLFVTQAAGGVTNAGSVSSYRLSDSGVVDVVSSSVATSETAACWVVVTKNGRFAYVTNGGSASVSAFRIQRDGSIVLRDADGRAGDTGAGSAPLDAALTHNSRYLYTLSPKNGTLSAFRVQADGALAVLPAPTGLPASANGLAAY